ncbi:PREDICTED: ubiquitin-like domain-containing CTD phosphatase 1 [Ceratosolen solmsi marchali]|uniref:Ubiquitin-like domain-containing CTD phosphatase 1 n=1 Tax=Ceratosolen solmsi marchali TaxID=326594 RepID=A0AAJ6YFF6_9HYME|nr:PREDICTED: ubiquitin-like domain-containing CTD phosphatase 1 [Ceratosolen solmsi marchali]
MENEIKITVKWSGEEYSITDIEENDTVLSLKEKIQKMTGVRPERQKLLNLKFKGKPAQDSDIISKLDLKQGFKLMMMGSREEDIAEVSQAPENMPDVINDLDIEEEEVEIEKAEIYLAKIQKRIETYKIQELNPLREGKKLLVLDIDYTLFDHRSVAGTGIELMRPYLHEFLTSAYKNYDIVIWSATNMKWINEKMKLLGVSNHPDYKISFYLDSLAMISVYTPKYGVVDVKPLGIIWGKYKQFSAKNTIMFDDIRRNFIMNPQSGLRIRAFKQAHLNRHKDRELLKLSKYLESIASLEDFQILNHRKWEEYRSKKSKSSKRTESDETRTHNA